MPFREESCRSSCIYSGPLHSHSRDAVSQHPSTRVGAESIQLIYSGRALQALSDLARQFRCHPIFWREFNTDKTCNTSRYAIHQDVQYIKTSNTDMLQVHADKNNSNPPLPPNLRQQRAPCPELLSCHFVSLVGLVFGKSPLSTQIADHFYVRGSCSRQKNWLPCRRAPALGVCFPQPCSNSGRRFAASGSRLHYYRRIVSFPQP